MSATEIVTVDTDATAASGTVPYRGAQLTLVPEPGRTRVFHSDERLLVPAEQAVRRRALDRWYRRQARSVLTPLVMATADELARRAPERVRYTYRRTAIRAQRTRWGSCSQSGTISLNWRLMLAADEVAEYVVVHEVCHLAEMNHSARFWDLLQLMLPDYQRPRSWLRKHGEGLLYII